MVGPRLGRAAVSGSHVPHLQRRDGIYHLRVRVPDGLRLRVGMLEVTRSLRTSVPTRARLLAAIYGPRVMEAFGVIKSGEFSKDDARQLVRSCFDDLAAETEDGFVPSTEWPELEIAEQREMSKERIAELRHSCHVRDFDGSTLAIASAYLARQGHALASLPSARRLDVLEGTARALIAQQQLFVQRLEDRLGQAAPLDPLFAAPSGHGGTTLPALSAPLCGPSLKDVFQDYLAAGAKKWTAKTLTSRVSRLRDMEEHFGGGRLIASITSHDVREFRNAVCRLRANQGSKKAQSFAGRQTENEAHRIQPKTANLVFETCKAFFRWAHADEGLIAANPAENVKVEVAKQAKAKKTRRPFTAEELKAVFSAPLFTGCKSVHRRSELGPSIIKDDYYWLPIVGFYTGARLGELVQLHCDDLDLTGPIPFITITDENGGAIGSHTAKHVKSHAGIRRVPMHPDLITLGFDKFVLERAKHKQASKRLFRRVAFGADGQASTVFSKWFGRFLDKAGLGDPALVFHSLRHNAEDAFRNGLQPQYVIDRIIGHTDGSTSAGYGEGVSLETMAGAVSSMKLHVRLPDLWCGI